MKYFNALLIIAITFLFACTEKTAPEGKKGIELSKFELLKNIKIVDRDKYNEISVYASSLENQFGGGSIHTVYKTRESDGTPVTYSDYLINNATLPSDIKVDDGNNREYTYYETNDAYKALFGKNLSISLTKENAAAKATTVEYKMYNPKLVKITNVAQIEHFVPTEDLTFSWERDLENKDQPLALKLLLITIGEEKKPAPTGSATVSIVKLIKDTGYFTISANELVVFPEESHVDISLYRANQEVIDDNIFSLYNCNSIYAITGKANK